TDHPVFVPGHGYVALGALTVGTELAADRETVQPMWGAGPTDPGADAQRQRILRAILHGRVDVVRSSSAAQGEADVHVRNVPLSVLRVAKPAETSAGAVLFQAVHGRGAEAKTSTSDLPSMQPADDDHRNPQAILLTNLREQGAQHRDDEIRKWAIRGRSLDNDL